MPPVSPFQGWETAWYRTAVPRWTMDGLIFGSVNQWFSSQDSGRPLWHGHSLITNSTPLSLDGSGTMYRVLYMKIQLLREVRSLERNVLTVLSQ